MTAKPDDLQMLINEIKGGSVRAFDELYERLAPFIFQIALKTTHDQKEAEDICHDVFLEVFRKPYGYEPSRGSVKAWLAVKTRSRSLDRLRKKQREILEEPKERPSAVFPGTAATATTEDLVFSKAEREALNVAMARIPAAQRRALQGKFFDARTQREIAEEMKRPVGTVKSLIRYGIRNVRKQLRQIGWTGVSSGGGDHDA